jgi:hypothetical protein
LFPKSLLTAAEPEVSMQKTKIEIEVIIMKLEDKKDANVDQITA